MRLLPTSRLRESFNNTVYSSFFSPINWSKNSIFCHVRFKLILGHLQLDNQLPLTPMPVLLAPEQTSDVNHPVFKMTVTQHNENTDGIQIYPYVYIRVMVHQKDAWNYFCTWYKWEGTYVHHITNVYIFTIGDWKVLEAKYSWTNYLGGGGFLQQSSARSYSPKF